jgi:TM2 domain-containing membrane protein YozV
MTKDLTDQQKMLFNSQYDSVKKDPTTMLLISIFVGGLGVDRFMLGDTGMGVLKLFTGGGCGILWLIDVIGSNGNTAVYNRKKAQEVLMAIKMSS